MVISKRFTASIFYDIFIMMIMIIGGSCAFCNVTAISEHTRFDLHTVLHDQNYRGDNDGRGVDLEVSDQL